MINYATQTAIENLVAGVPYAARREAQRRVDALLAQGLEDDDLYDRAYDALAPLRMSEADRRAEAEIEAARRARQYA